MALLRIIPLLTALLVLTLGPAAAQDDDVAAEQISRPPVALTFTPPGLEGDIVLGVFDAAGKLVRTMRFDPESPELTIDTNGYIAKWNGLDDAGKPCAAGRYSAHGFVVGDAVAVEGEDFHFNDWMAEDKIPATGVELSAWPDAFGVKIATVGRPVFAKIHADGTVEMASEPAPGPNATKAVPPQFDPAPLAWAMGRDESTWIVVDDAGQNVVTQLAKDRSVDRTLRVDKGEPQPIQVLASMNEDAILLKETAPGGVERVRMLRRVANPTATAVDGKVVADWEVVFERTLQPCANFGVVDGKLVADVGAVKPSDAITLDLVENALTPGKKDRLRVVASATQPGGALVTSDAMKLVEISKDGGWNRLAFGATDAHRATLFQGDGVVVEEFSIQNLDQIAAFDAGSFLFAPAQ